MKLGTGNINYKFKFIYKDNNRVAIKNVYSNNIYEALNLFNNEYKNYNIEIVDIKIVNKERI